MLLAPTLQAVNWPQWRGPAFNGSSPEAETPTVFSRTENVRWSTAMPGPAAATPVVWEDRVFVSSTDATARTLVALALDRKTGTVLWQKKVSDGFGRDPRSNYASPSPVTDGQRAIFLYGNGALVAFDLKGRELWHRNLEQEKGPFAMQWTYAASPLLHGSRLYLQVLQRNVPVNGRGPKILMQGGYDKASFTSGTEQHSEGWKYFGTIAPKTSSVAFRDMLKNLLT